MSVQVASPASATALYLASISGWHVWQKKIEFHSEHVLNLICKAKNLINVRAVSLPSPLYNEAENTVVFLCGAICTTVNVY